ncbi:class I SAM-dependent methyltransferase [uncultured Bradyrhizobium sp.]|uniref:class I SAM-dependent methyltransferase n=1 Tax=uncultured Bradyrhizobium sp. TaxID=199684 RepID=UPI0035CC2077
MCSARKSVATIFLALVSSAGVSARMAVAETVIPLAPPGVGAAAFPAPDRPVAGIISPEWASEDERRSANETEQVFELLGIRPGMRVGDIGAGSGFYTMALSRAVGPAGEVLAQDITPKYLEALQRRVRTAKVANVRVGLGEAHDPRLPARMLDAAVLIHMYHEIAQPYALLFNLAAAMKPDALVGIVDLDRATGEHGTPPNMLRCELAAVGYREAGFHQLKGDVGYLAIFKPPLHAKQPSEIKACGRDGKAAAK